MATPTIADHAAAIAIPQNAAAAADDADAPADAAPTPESILPRPLSINITPILKSAAAILTDADIDQWLPALHQANEGRGFNLELTHKGDLVITPMVNRDGGRAEAMMLHALVEQEIEHGGEVYGANANLRLPDGSRIRPDALWLSPEQVAALPPVSAGGAITICPAFVVEIMSATDTLPPLQRKMAQYLANGAQLAWLIDPYRRRVHIYRPDHPAEILDNPETISGDPVLPGFTFAIRRRIFDLHAPA